MGRSAGGYNYDALEAKFKWMREEQARKALAVTPAPDLPAPIPAKDNAQLRLDRLLVEHAETAKRGQRVRIMVPTHRATYQRGMLGQRKTKRGMVWYCRFRLPKIGAQRLAKQVHITIGLASEISEAEAAEKMATLIDRVSKQKDFAKQFGMRATVRALKTQPTIKRTADSRAVIHGLCGHVGAVSELLVCVDLMGKGQEVFRALNPQASCDLISHHDGEFTRIEVRTLPQTAAGNSSQTMSLTRKAGKFDILALVHFNGIIDYIPYACIEENGHMYLKKITQPQPSGKRAEGDGTE